MKRILFVNDEMCMGGVARVLNTLMGSLDSSEYEVDLLVLHPHGEMLDEVPDNVRILPSHPFFSVVDLSLSQALKMKNLKVILHKVYLVLLLKTGLIQNKIKKIRKEIIKDEYDVEFAAKEGFCTIFVACGKAKRKVNWVLVDYEVFNYSKNHLQLLKKVLKDIDINIADSEKAAKAFQNVFGVENVKAIHTLMDEDRVKKGSVVPLPATLLKDEFPTVITVGRFHHQKGIERLIEASIETVNQGTKHRLFIIGAGELEEQFLKLAEGHKHIEFLGLQKNPYNWISFCDLFVLPSYYEGFATIVSESLIAGTPVLATEVAGIHEQLKKPEHGRIVANNQEAITNGLYTVLNDKEYLKECKIKLLDYHYPNEEILKEYLKEFSEYAEEN
jgi:Glycosyltransferase